MQRYHIDQKIFRDSLQEKWRYKLYKRGKLWVTAGISLLYSGLMLAMQPHTVQAASEAPQTTAKTSASTATTTNATTVPLQTSEATTSTQATAPEPQTAATAASETPASSATTDAAVAADVTSPTPAATTTSTPDATPATPATAYAGIAATITGQTITVGQPVPATYAVTLAGGLQAPTWTAADFAQSLDATQVGSGTVTLSAAGINALQAANPTVTFSAANVAAGTVTVQAVPATTPATATQATTPVVPATPNTYNTEAASKLTAAAQQFATAINNVATQGQQQAAASDTDTIVADAGLTALNEHAENEQQQVVNLIQGAQSIAATEPTTALNDLIAATAIINNLSQELGQATTMVDQDQHGVDTATVAQAQAALDASSLPGGVSAALSAYGDLIISATTPQAYDQAVATLQATDLLGDFRQVVDPSTATLTVSAGSSTTLTSLNTHTAMSLTATVTAGDTVVLTFPKEVTERDIVADKVSGLSSPVENADGTISLTYQASQDGVQNINFEFYWGGIVYDDIDADSEDGMVLPVTLTQNGELQDTVNFTVVDKPTYELTAVNQVLQQGNVTGPLTTGQQYLMYTTMANIDGNTSHIVESDPANMVYTVEVPAGFVVDAVMPYSGSANNTDVAPGKSINSNTLLLDGGVPSSLTPTDELQWQQASVGEPVTWSLAGANTSAGYGSDMIIGHYTQALAATDNVFTETLAYNGPKQTLTSAPFQMSSDLSVVADTANYSDQLADSIMSDLGEPDQPVNEINLDNPDADGVQPSTTGLYNMSGTRSLVVLNTSNQPETNVVVSVDFEPGTEINNINFEGSTLSDAQSLVINFTDGTSTTIAAKDLNALYKTLTGYVIDSGKTVKNLTLTLGQLIPADGFRLMYTAVNGIVTDKAVGDTVTETVNLTSDQYSTSATYDRTIVAPTLKPNNVWYSMMSTQNNLYHIGDTFVLSAQLTQTLASNDWGKYYIIAPFDADLTSVSMSSGSVGEPDIPLTDLGLVTINGEQRHAYLADLSDYDYQFAKNDTSLQAEFRAVFVIPNSAVPYTGNYSLNATTIIQANDSGWDQDYLTTQPIVIGDTTIDAVTAGVSPDPQLYDSGNDFKYQVVVPAFYGAQDGIDDPLTAANDYLSYDATAAYDTTARFSRGISADTSDDINSSTIRMVTVNTTSVSSPLTQNIITLPSTGAGDDFTLELTGAGELSGLSTATAKLLYSTQVIKADNALVDASQFVDASQVTDWSAIRTIMLTTETMNNGDMAIATLPVAVADINTVPSGTTAIFPSSFLGYDADGKLVQLDTQEAASVVQQANVTTQWVQLMQDGSTQPIKPEETVAYPTGSAYTTTPLTNQEIPTGDTLSETPANASGTITDANVTVTYLYYAQKQSVLIPYINVTSSPKTNGWTAADGKTVLNQSVSGYGGTTYTNTLKIPARYHLAAPGSYDPGAVAGTFVVSTDRVKTNAYVYVVDDTKTFTPTDPGTPGEPINPDDPTDPFTPNWPEGIDKDSLQKTVTETVHYVKGTDDTTIAPDHTDTVTFTRTATVDEVTAAVTYSDWVATDEDTTFDAVTSPAVAGWTPETATYAAVTGLTQDSSDIEETIKYDQAIQNGSVTYIDDTTGKTLITDPFSGQSGTLSDYTTTSRLSGYEEAGYALVSSDFPDTGVTFDDDATVDQDFTVHLSEKTVPVTPDKPGDPGQPIDPTEPNGPKWPETGVDKSDLDKVITETLHYLKDDTTTAFADHDDQVEFTRTGTLNEVTGVMNYTDWAATNDDDSFDAVTSPALAGWTPDQATYAAVTGLTQDSENVEATIIYSQDTQQANVAFVDDTTGVQLYTEPLSGKSGTTSDYSPATKIDTYEEQGYSLVSSDFPAAGLVFDTDATVDQDFTIHLSEKTVPVTPDKPGDPGQPIDPTDPNGPKWPDTGVDKTDLDKVVTETLHYQMSDKTKAFDDHTDQVEFTRDGTLNEVTGGLTYTDWVATANDNSFDAVTSPTKAGYTPDIALYGAVNDLTPTSDNVEATITYTAGEQKATVTYIDDTTTQTLNVEALTGASDSKSTYTTATAIAAYQLAGYKLVSDDFPATGLTFDTDDAVDQAFTVHLIELTKTVTPSNPGKPGDPIDPDNPNGPKFPETGTDTSDLQKMVTQVIHYVKDDGTTAFDDNNDSVTFTRTATINEVTGAISDTDWVATNNDTTFDAVDSPVLAGYFADKAVVPETDNLTQDSENIETTVTYTKLGNWVPNLPDVPTTQYPNDPTDPSQPADPTDPDFPTIPYVPGYTPNDPSGDPLQPVDPENPNQGYIPPAIPSDPGTDTNITYVKDTQKADVDYLDDTTGASLSDDPLTGDSDSTSDYTTATKISTYELAGYGFVSSDFPADGLTFDEDQTVDQHFTVHFTELTKTVTPDNPGKPGDPIDPQNPDGPKFPATGTDTADLQKTVTQVIHYVKDDGTTAFDDNNDSVTFTRTATINEVTGAISDTDWIATNDDTTFAAVDSPELTGYFADKAVVPATDNLTQDSENIETTVTYAKLGNWVPNLPDVPTTQYPNDPADPSQPADPTDPDFPTIPYVPGYTPNDPNGDPLQPVDPENPNQGYIPPAIPSDPGTDTNITYVKDTQKADVEYLDDTTGASLSDDPLTGDSDSTSDYTTATKISTYELAGYGFVSSDFPADGLTFDEDQTVDQHFTELTKTVTPDNPGKPGDPIDPQNPDGPKFPATGTDTADLQKTVTQVIHYVKDDGTTAFDDNNDSVAFTRTATINEVTGAISDTDWIATNDDTTFDAVNSPVLTGYFADKAVVPATTGLTQDSADLDTTVTYTKLGNWVPNLPDVPTTAYPNDPTDPSRPADPTEPNFPTMPYVPGYTPNDPNGDPLQPVDPENPNKGYIPPAIPSDPGTDTNITYNADDQRAIVDYIDDTTGANLVEDSLTGDSDSQSDYTTATRIATYEQLGYGFVSSDFPETGLTFDDDDSALQQFTVHFTELTKTVTPNNPGKPGDPIDPQNPDGPKFPATGTDTADLQKTVTQVIHYLKDDGSQAFDDNDDSVTFTRTGTINEVTGAISYTDWVATNDDTTFAAVASPELAGYFADKAVVPETDNLTQDSADLETTVTYAKFGNWVPNLPDVPTTAYPNDPTDPSKPADPTDPNFPTIPYVPGYTPTDPNGEPLQPADPENPNQGYIPPAIPADPGTDTQITYVGDDQQATVSYIDDTTGATLKAETLTGASDTASDYDPTSTISGYEETGYALVSSDFPATGLTFDDDDSVDQAFTIHLTEKVIPITPTEPGDPGQPIDPADPNGPQWPDTGVSKTDLTQTVTRTIHYVKDGQDQAFPDNVDTVSFTRTGLVNEVTGATTYTDWVATDNDTTFDAVTSPVLTDYLADQAEVAALTNIVATADDSAVTVNYTKLGNWVPNDPTIPTTPYPNDPIDPAEPLDPSDPGYPTLPNKPGYTPEGPDGQPLTPVDPEDPNKGYIPPALPAEPSQNTNITYVADNQKAQVTYVDDTTGATLVTDSLGGDSGAKSDYTTTDRISTYENAGYALVSSDFPAAGLTFDDDDSALQQFTVHLSEKTTTATPANPGIPGSPIDPSDPNGPKWPTGTDKDSLTDTVTETITYVNGAGEPVAPTHTATITFTRTAIVYEVTGTVGYTAWIADGSSTFAAVTSPSIAGFTPDQSEIAAITVAAGADDISKVVTYTADPTPATPAVETPETPATPAKTPVASAKPAVTPALPQTGTPAKAQPQQTPAKALPQTGDRQATGLVAAGLAVLASLGLLLVEGDIKKRKHN